MENTETPAAIKVNGMFADTLKGMLGYLRKELIIRGILFLILGLLMLFKPGQTLLAITITIGVFILLDGISMFIAALRYHGQNKLLFLLNSVFFILLGIFTCTAPLIMDIVWVIMIGIWQLFSGIQCLTFKSSAGGSAIFSGICGIIAGLILITTPLLGMMTLLWIMGFVSFLNGFSAIILGIRMKKALK